MRAQTLIVAGSICSWGEIYVANVVIRFYFYENVPLQLFHCLP